MNLTKEQLEEIEAMAGLFFSVDDICTNLELDEEDTEYFKACVEVKGDYNFARAFRKGRITAEIQLRQSIKQAALNGSNPAQSSMLDFYKQSLI